MMGEVLRRQLKVRAGIDVDFDGNEPERLQDVPVAGVPRPSDGYASASLERREKREHEGARSTGRGKYGILADRRTIVVPVVLRDARTELR